MKKGSRGRKSSGPAGWSLTTPLHAPVGPELQSPQSPPQAESGPIQWVGRGFGTHQWKPQENCGVSRRGRARRWGGFSASIRRSLSRLKQWTLRSVVISVGLLGVCSSSFCSGVESDKELDDLGDQPRDIIRHSLDVTQRDLVSAELESSTRFCPAL